MQIIPHYLYFFKWNALQAPTVPNLKNFWCPEA